MSCGFKTRPLPHEAANRRLFHAVFADWTCNASEAEFDQLERLRDQFAPNTVCSSLSLVQFHLERKDLAKKLPPTLRSRLQAKHWPRACVAVLPPAGAA